VSKLELDEPLLHEKRDVKALPGVLQGLADDMALVYARSTGLSQRDPQVWPTERSAHDVCFVSRRDLVQDHQIVVLKDATQYLLALIVLHAQNILRLPVPRVEFKRSFAHIVVCAYDM